jgi:hypothetical protein
MANGIKFDFSNENDFKAYVVQQLGKLDGVVAKADKVPIIEQEVADIRKTMDEDKLWTNIKSYSGPVLVGLHIAAKKLGINI